jgi:hypothetical protein
MGDMTEDRVYGDRRDETVAYVASEQGVATVRLASDRVGRFALAHRCVARDVTTGSDRVYVATDEGVVVGPDDFEPTAFDGEAVAVTAGGPAGDVLAADEQGTVSRYRDGEWTALGSVPGVRALSGDLVAASDGLYRVAGDDLTHVGLSDARDVATGGAPLAATGAGLYRLGPGWTRDCEGAFEVVGADRAGDRAHAATADALYARDDDEWEPVDLPVDGRVADVAYRECVYAVTREGTFLVAAGPDQTADGTGGWRSRALGLPAVAAVAVSR